MRFFNSGTKNFLAIFLALFTALLLAKYDPGAKAQTTSCSLSGGDDTTVLVFSGQGIRSDMSAENSFVDLNGTVPAGTYEIALQSYDDHSGGAPHEQPNENWLLQLKRNDGSIIASTQAISDLPTAQDTLVEVVESEMELTETAVSLTAMHTVYFDDTNPNSVTPVCAAFRLIEEEEDQGPGSDDDGNGDANDNNSPPRRPYCTRFDFEMSENDYETGAYPGTFRMFERGTGNLLATWEVGGSDLAQPTRIVDSGEYHGIHPNFYPSTHAYVEFTPSNPDWTDVVKMSIINHAPSPDEAYGSLTADRCDAIEIEYPSDFPPGAEDTAVTNGQTNPTTTTASTADATATSKQPASTSLAKKPDSKCETAVSAWQAEASNEYDVQFSGGMVVVASTPFYDDVQIETDDGLTTVRVLKGVSMSAVLSDLGN